MTLVNHTALEKAIGFIVMHVKTQQTKTPSKIPTLTCFQSKKTEIRSTASLSKVARLLQNYIIYRHGQSQNRQTHNNRINVLDQSVTCINGQVKTDRLNTISVTQEMIYSYVTLQKLQDVKQVELVAKLLKSIKKLKL